MAVVSSVGRATAGNSAAINTVGAKLFVAFVANFGSAGTFSDSQGNIWTPLTVTNWAGGSGVGRLYYSVLPSTSASHIFSFNSNDACFYIIAFDDNKMFDGQQSVANSQTPPCSAGAITPAAANGLIVAGFGCSHETMANAAIGSGFTLLGLVPGLSGSNQGVGLAYLYQVGGPSSVNPVWTGNATASHVGCAIASFMETVPTAAARTSHDVVETLILPVPSINVSQSIPEVLTLPAPPINISQYIPETVTLPVPPLNISQYTIEILTVAGAFVPSAETTRFFVTMP